MDTGEFLRILAREVKPSLACTEPGAVALCAAAASDNNALECESIELTVSPDVYKNCMAVGIPGFSQKGIMAAVCLGAAAGDFHKGLECLKGVTDEGVRKAWGLIERKASSVVLSDNGIMLYIEAVCRGRKGTGRAVIADVHDRLVYREVNSQVLLDERSSIGSGKDESEEVLMRSSLEDLLEVVESCSLEDLGIIKRASEMNIKASEYGLEHKSGCGIGAALLEAARPGSEMDLMQAYTCAAIDARLSGAPVSVMTCAGSGSHGATAIVPVVIAARQWAVPEERMLRAVALSCLVTVYHKEYSGKLSAMCGCAVSSGTGVAAALSYMRGGGLAAVRGSIKNMAGGITGMICDGAKEGCSLKLAAGVAAAWHASSLALRGIVIPDDNGILSSSAERTMQNVGSVSALGMAGTDKTILEIMQNGKE